MELMYITNQPDIALYAESVGIDRVFVDLEIVGKQERQGHLDTVISQHSLDDIPCLRRILSKAKLMVRVNPLYAESEKEIEKVLQLGADIVMLPMFKTAEEVATFVSLVDKRATVCLLLETPEALARIDDILNVEGIDEIHIGLNDLHLGLHLDFMFELLSGGLVDYMSEKIKAKGIPFGFGGIARIGSGVLSADLILSEHYRLGSNMVILSREFHGRAKDLNELKRNLNLPKEIEKIRLQEEKLRTYSEDVLQCNANQVKAIVRELVLAKRTKSKGES